MFAKWRSSAVADCPRSFGLPNVRNGSNADIAAREQHCLTFPRPGLFWAFRNGSQCISLGYEPALSCPTAPSNAELNRSAGGPLRGILR